MVHDWGSRDATFVGINKAVLDELPKIIHGGEDFVTVPMQGSGTFAVEAMLTPSCRATARSWS
jgi:2-aminoethylphosphonate-pyruvate transaminase